MAYDVVLRPSQSRAKVRNAWGVLGLSLVTLGIYSIFWWYFINREMADLGRSRNARDLGDSPGISTLAISLGGWLIIPPIWTLVTTCKRIQRAQRLVGRDDRLNGWLVAGLAFFTLGLGVHVYMQSELNKVWQSDDIEALQSGGAGALPATATAPPDGMERLQRLNQLRSDGALTDEEFETQKAKVLQEL